MLFVYTPDKCVCVFVHICSCLCGCFHLHVFISIICICKNRLFHRGVFAYFQNELVFTDIIRLSLNGALSEGPEGAQQPSIGKVSITLHITMWMYRNVHIYFWKKFASVWNIVFNSSWLISVLDASCPQPVEHRLTSINRLIISSWLAQRRGKYTRYVSRIPIAGFGCVTYCRSLLQLH